MEKPRSHKIIILFRSKKINEHLQPEFKTVPRMVELGVKRRMMFITRLLKLLEHLNCRKSANLAKIRMINCFKGVIRNN